VHGPSKEKGCAPLTYIPSYCTCISHLIIYIQDKVEIFKLNSRRRKSSYHSKIPSTIPDTSANKLSFPMGY